MAKNQKLSHTESELCKLQKLALFLLKTLS